MNDTRRVVMAYLAATVANETDNRIKEFLKANPEPSDDQVHDLAAELGEDKHKFEERIYKMLGACMKTASDNKEAMDFSSIAPVLNPGKKMDERETARAIRQAIAAEHDAAHLYELIADSCENKVVAELVQDIADEEKVHVGELQWLLSQLDKDNGRLLQEGVDEARKEDE